MFTHWSSQRLFNRPPEMGYASPYSCRRDSCLGRPFAYVQGKSIESYWSICTSIISLFFCSAPFTIFGGVPFLIVNSFYRMLRRTIPHIIMKIFKGFPWQANFYTATSVSMEPSDGWVIASGQHGLPNTISLSPACTMLRESSHGRFTRQTATAFSVIVSQGVAVYNHVFPAVTNTIPSNSCILIRCLRNHCEAVEYFSSNIDEYMKFRGFPHEASATLGVTSGEFASLYCSIFSARANTIPMNSFILSLIFSARDYSESFKSLTGEVDEFAHNILHKMLFHMKCVCQPVWRLAFGATLDTSLSIPQLGVR